MRGALSRRIRVGAENGARRSRKSSSSSTGELRKKRAAGVSSQMPVSYTHLDVYKRQLDQYAQLITLPVRQWSHCVIAPEGHPILKSVPLSLAELAKWPLITYDPAFTGRSRINRAFERIGVSRNVALTALDADVIKTYVSLCLLYTSRCV